MFNVYRYISKHHSFVIVYRKDKIIFIVCYLYMILALSSTIVYRLHPTWCMICDFMNWTELAKQDTYLVEMYIYPVSQLFVKSYIFNIQVRIVAIVRGFLSVLLLVSKRHPCAEANCSLRFDLVCCLFAWGIDVRPVCAKWMTIFQ